MKFSYPYGTPETREPLLGVIGVEEEVFPALKEMGYLGIEPFVRNPRLFDVNRFEKQVERFGLKVVAVGTGPVVSDDRLTFTDEDALIRSAAIQRAKDIVDFAALFGCTVNIGKVRGEVAHPRQQSWDWMIDAIERVCTYADKRGITVTLEPQNKQVINNLNTTLEALSFLEKLNIPNLELMLDVYHMHIEDPSVEESVRMAAGSFLHVHLADSNREAPGTGELNFTSIINALRSVGYDGFATFEVKQGEDSYKAAKQSIEHVLTILNAN